MSATLRIRGDKGDNINILVKKYLHGADADSYDANWLSCEVSLSVGAFKARYDAKFQTIDFIEFNKRLAELYIEVQSKEHVIQAFQTVFDTQKYYSEQEQPLLRLQSILIDLLQPFPNLSNHFPP